MAALSHTHESATLLAFPGGEGLNVPAKQISAVREEVENSPLAALHRIETADGAPGMALLAERGVAVTSMGRTPADDPLFFHAASAAGALAAAHIRPGAPPAP